ncbi:MAG: hypothetical protein F4227_08475, partial [Gammaproteobacteria bacterium]|nr:hypothetical protein [Gammaproteobacteria bacterium]
MRPNPSKFAYQSINETGLNTNILPKHTVPQVARLGSQSLNENAQFSESESKFREAESGTHNILS